MGEVATWKEKYESVAADLEANKVCQLLHKICILIFQRNQHYLWTRQAKRRPRLWYGRHAIHAIFLITLSHFINCRCEDCALKLWSLMQGV